MCKYNRKTHSRQIWFFKNKLSKVESHGNEKPVYGSKLDLQRLKNSQILLWDKQNQATLKVEGGFLSNNEGLNNQPCILKIDQVSFVIR